MPTTRPRIVITETPQVTRALNDAARRWPGDSRSKLVLHLLDEGHQAVIGHREQATSERRRAIDATAGALTDLYGDGYLDELRADWPE